MDSAERSTRVPVAVWLTLLAMVVAGTVLWILATLDDAREVSRQELNRCAMGHVLAGYTLGESEEMCRVLR